MANKTNTYTMYVRAIPKARTALKRMLGELSGVDDKVTQEILVTATWLWLNDLGHEVVYEKLKPYIAEIKAALEADKADLSPPAPREPVIKDVNHKRGSSSRPKRGAG